MQFKQMLLMCSALVMMAYSFPTEPKQSTKILSQNETSILNAKENRKRPFVVIMEDNNPKSDSVVVEFVYSSNGGNSILQSTGSDKEKYAVNHPVPKEKTGHTNTSSKNEKEKLTHTNTDKSVQDKVNDSIPDQPKLQIMAGASLIPQEVSPLSEPWPKYFFDAFIPIHPFPELEEKKSNQIFAVKVASKNGDKYSTYYEKERKEPPFVAGPRLNPLSIYERDLNVPIFG